MAAKKKSVRFEKLSQLQLMCALLYGCVFVVLFAVVIMIVVGVLPSSPNDVWLFSLFSGMVGVVGGYLFGSNSDTNS